MSIFKLVIIVYLFTVLYSFITFILSRYLIRKKIIKRISVCLGITLAESNLLFWCSLPWSFSYIIVSLIPMYNILTAGVMFSQVDSFVKDIVDSPKFTYFLIKVKQILQNSEDSSDE